MGRASRIFGPTLGVLCAACGSSVSGGAGDTSADGDAPSEMSPNGTEDGAADSSGGPTLAVVLTPSARRLDILFVVDNSSSMARAQDRLTAYVASLVGDLERREVDADFRIGITTTDNGNPWCNGTSPEGGALVFSSCLARSEDFVVHEEALDVACSARCNLESFDILPSPLVPGGEAVARPWLESVGGKSNIANASASEAIACALPQGVSGCGFEQPLESMYQSLLRMDDPQSPSFGFVRADADLFIVFVTDEADCSYADESIFLPGGDRTFWSDPDDGVPTSAVCWRAGVACDGSSCQSVDLDALGAETNGGRAVLHPVSRYTAHLQAIEEAKQFGAPGKRVGVQLIGGAQEDGSFTYPPASDPALDAAFGIGFGCTSDFVSAIPPVRMREVGQVMSEGEQFAFSICGAYDIALQTIVWSTGGQGATCFPACVADTDPTTPEAEPRCVLTLEVPAEDGALIQQDLPECSDQGGVPPEASHCFWPSGFVPPARCGGDGFNLGLIFRHAPGTAFPLGARIIANCELSMVPDLDCPDTPD